jgi:hypothetical protein
VLSGESPTKASYQLVVMRCPECGRAQQSAGGEVIEVSTTIAEMAECDGKVTFLHGLTWGMKPRIHRSRESIDHDVRTGARSLDPPRGE